MYEPHIVELTRIKYRVLRILPFSSLLSVSTLVLYLAYRAKSIIATSANDGYHAIALNSTLYFIAELGLFIPGLLDHVLRCLAVFPGHRTAPHLRFSENDSLPSVDVFLTVCGEEPKMVENTAAAACAIDYPADRFRVIVLDDGDSKELADLIGKLATERENLFYTARVKGKVHHFKAGNLNHGAQYVASLPGGPAEYIAALDADMIPDPQWLRALLPHMVKNPKLSLAQPPQRFYDVPSGDALLQGLDVNFKVVEPLKESMGSTWCGGSGYVLRRAALEDIGWYPTDSVGEDMYCSNILLGKGWETIYVDETLQTGRVPESYKSHVTQQGRWHVGRLQTAIAMRFYLFGEKARFMGFRQRVVGLIYVLLSLCNILTTVGMATLLLSLATGLPLITYRSQDELRLLIRLVSATLIGAWLDDCVVSFVTGYRIAISESHINYWIAPYHAEALIRAFSPQWLRSGNFQFTASGSMTEKTPQLDAARKSVKDLWHTIQSSRLSLHLVYIILIGLALAHNLVRVFQVQAPSVAQSLLVRNAWPPIFWLIIISSFSVPLSSALNPSTIPNRSQLLKRDPVRRASYPEGVGEQGESSIIWSQSVFYSLVVTYVVFLVLWEQSSS